MTTTLKPEARALRGKRYIAYARCAAQRGSASKLRQQIRLIRQFGDRLQMRCVDEDRIAGVSGFAPTLRPDLQQLLARKQKQDDFDVLIMEDHARLTRTDGAGRIEALFALHGVRIVYLTEAWTWHRNGTGRHHLNLRGRTPTSDEKTAF